jgi:hypothetical protein
MARLILSRAERLERRQWKAAQQQARRRLRRERREAAARGARGVGLVGAWAAVAAVAWTAGLTTALALLALLSLATAPVRAAVWALPWPLRLGALAGAATVGGHVWTSMPAIDVPDSVGQAAAPVVSQAGADAGDLVAHVAQVGVAVGGVYFLGWAMVRALRGGRR